MWILLIALTLGSPEGSPERPVIQRPGEPVVWGFVWEAPPECPSRDQVIASVRSYLPEIGSPPAMPASADLRVIVQVQPDGTNWTASVKTRGRTGESERRFSAPNCAELADAVALVSAVALDPVLVARQVAIERQSEPNELSARSSGAEFTERIEPQSRPTTASDDSAIDNLDLVLTPLDEPPARTLRFGVGVFGTGAYGPTTTGFGGVAASFAVFRDRWRWQLEGGYSIPRTLDLDDGRRGRVQSWWLGTRGCFVPTVESSAGPLETRVEFPLCPGFEAGQVFARGLAPTTNTSTERQPWAAIVVGQGLRWPFIEQLALTVDASVLVSLFRGEFVIGDESLTAITPVGFRGALGLEARF